MSHSVKARLRATALHLIISLLVAAACAVLVFGVWYPSPYAVLAGGVNLFVLITSVDVVMGPLLTLVAFNVEKSLSHLRRDLITIAAFQLLALMYGLHMVYEARPALLAAENGLFRVVAANEIDGQELGLAPQGMREISLTGPRLVGVRPARNGDEKLEAIQRALEGYDGGARPSFWEPYDASRARVKGQLKPLNELGPLGPDARSNLDLLLKQKQKTGEQVGYMPVKARAQGWIVLIERANADVIGFVPVD